MEEVRVLPETNSVCKVVLAMARHIIGIQRDDVSGIKEALILNISTSSRLIYITWCQIEDLRQNGIIRTKTTSTIEFRR